MVITFEDLPDIRKRHAAQTIAFSSGSFDITHAGHVLFLEDAKKNGDILIVMVGSDAAIRRNKGSLRPVMNEHLRMKMIDSLKPVDYTILDNLSHNTDHPLDVVEKIFQELKPDVYVVNDDGFDLPYRKNISAKHSVPMLVLSRTAPPEFEKISASGIIEKMKRLEDGNSSLKKET